MQIYWPINSCAFYVIYNLPNSSIICHKRKEDAHEFAQDSHMKGFCRLELKTVECLPLIQENNAKK